MKKLQFGVGISVVLFLVILFVLTQMKRGADEITIGVILPLTGEMASHAYDAKQGIELAIRIRNASGGIDGKTVRAIYEDDRMTPAVGVSAFQKLTSQDKVQVVLGALSSTVALAIAPFAQREQVVFFSPTASHPRLTKGNSYVFRNWPSDDYDARVMADFCSKTLSIKHVAVLYVNNDNGRALSELFEKRFKELGYNILLRESYEPGTSDFRTVLSKIREQHPGAIYIPGYYQEVAKILVQAKEIGIQTQFVASSAIESPKLIDLAGNAAEGLIYSKTYVDEESVSYRRFLEEYKDLFSSAPGIAAAQSFDAANIIMLAIDRGGYRSESIKDHISKVKDYPGVTGTTSFDKNGDVVKRFSIFTVKGGKFVAYLDTIQE